ncbi:MAG: site-2 protease family protein [Sphingomonadales bacterium]|nr:site-2 protease family protein [Sphingomonadales bacterium]
MNNPLWDAATLILPLVLAIVCHEVAHGWVARMLGDTTAAEHGRLTLNPIAHIDPFGTVILPGMLALAHLPVFGWARPVPIDARRLPNPRRDMMVVGAAGPLSNLVLATFTALAIGAMAGVQPGRPADFSFFAWCLDNLRNFLEINVFLALFNLLPIPPFDGSHIVEGVLPLPLAVRYGRLRRWALPAVLILIVILPQLFPQIDLVSAWVGPPFEWLMRHYGALAGWSAGLFRG